ncbi:c2H2-type domain-containing protein [Trichonephila clavipes]|nr:c2H2-type domain-containing protein [Trichonephila clavipes]
MNLRADASSGLEEKEKKIFRYGLIIRSRRICIAFATEFTSRLSASSVKRLANPRLHLGRNEVSDWLDARHSTFVRLGVNEPLRLSESDRTAIAGRLKEGVSEKNFLQNFREEITVDSGRKMLIEKKDIHNIKRDFNINGYVKRYEIDAVSVKLWAQEMKNNEK